VWDLFRVVPSKPVADEDTSVTPVEPERARIKPLSRGCWSTPEQGGPISPILMGLIGG
jgi:hypothetical protein